MDFGLGGILEELCFGLASLTTLATASSYSKYKTIWRNLEKAPVITVSQELGGAMKQETTLPYAVITGRVYPMQGEKILDTISGMPAVISKLNVKEFRWVDTFSSVLISGQLDVEDSRLSPALKYVPFALANPNAVTSNLSPKEPFVLVDDVSNGEFDELLVTAKATYIPSEVTLTGLLASVLRGFHSVGVETSESVLPVGTVITVIGEVTKLSGNGNGYRVAKSPAGGDTTPYILTTKNILEVKSDVGAQAAVFKVLSFLCGCITIMTFYAVGKKWLPRFRLRRIQRLIQRERTRINTQGLHETQICVACLQNPREVALLPCGHVCVCADCSVLIQEKCPVCRQNVTETIPIFLA